MLINMLILPHCSNSLFFLRCVLCFPDFIYHIQTRIHSLSHVCSGSKNKVIVGQHTPENQRGGLKATDPEDCLCKGTSAYRKRASWLSSLTGSARFLSLGACNLQVGPMRAKVSHSHVGVSSDAEDPPQNMFIIRAKIHMCKDVQEVLV